MSNLNIEIPKAVKEQVWQIIKIAKSVKDGKVFCATGFIIPFKRQVHVATNSHVILQNGSTSEFWMIDSSKKAYPLQLIWNEPKHDFAILKSSIDILINDTYITTDLKNFDQNSVVYTGGYNDEDIQAALPIFQKGIIAERSKLIINDDVVIAAPNNYEKETALGFFVKGFRCPKGSSGSPVLNEEGKTIGYVKGHHNSLEDGEALCITIHKLNEILNGL